MPYTTGELAKACGVTVRTVQYYDRKGLLEPSDYSEGGRRLYTEADAEQLRFICMLKSLGLELSQIKGLLESPNRDSVLELVLEERASQLAQEIEELQQQLSAVKVIRKDMELCGTLRIMTESGIAQRLKGKQVQRRHFAQMIAIGIVLDIAEISTLAWGIATGAWWPLVLTLVVCVIVVAPLVLRYHAHVTYICPACKHEFRAKLVTFFGARHTPRTRKLECPRCSTRDWCVERYHAQRLNDAPQNGAASKGETCEC